uniref:Ig-like domain-containing protein n=1 Tax=Laticauda laticaudata TaxID=8630 RepID=A0A8C5WT09_LATLA
PIQEHGLELLPFSGCSQLSFLKKFTPLLVAQGLDSLMSFTSDCRSCSGLISLMGFLASTLLSQKPRLLFCLYSIISKSKIVPACGLLFWAPLCLSYPSLPPAKPTVTISPTKMDPTGFYLLEIEVQWLKNGQLEEEGVAFGEELQNGDWTYQLQVILETQPQRGDPYTCKVGHASLEVPITVQWDNSAKSKLRMGIMGALIGVAFLAMGLFSYLKTKKGESGGLEEREPSKGDIL